MVVNRGECVVVVESVGVVGIVGAERVSGRAVVNTLQSCTEMCGDDDEKAVVTCVF